MSGSVSFDRAAGYYDRTRAVADDIMVQLIPLLVAELPRGETCLEVGIGTGRIALPITEAGVRVVGIDISREMLRKLREKGDGGPPVAVADATRLPFGADTFGSAIASHVFHLIPGWRTAIDEVTRVVRPGGVLLVSRGGRNRSPWLEQVTRHFFVEAGEPPWPPGASSIDEVDALMRERGVEARPLPDIGLESVVSIGRVIGDMEAGYWAACWAITPEVRASAAAATRDWAREQFGDIDDARHAVWESSTWHAFDLPK